MATWRGDSEICSVYRSTTKHHRMQGLFLWHCTDWKDVLYSAGWLEILPASRVTTFSRTRVRMASKQYSGNKACPDLYLSAYKRLLWNNVFCQQCPNHEQRGFIVVSLGICIILKHFLCHGCVYMWDNVCYFLSVMSHPWTKRIWVCT